MKKTTKYIVVAICLILVLITVLINVWKVYNINQKQVPVLVYHNIVQTAEQKNNDQDTLTVEEFENQLKYLKENGYKAITAEEFYNWKTKKDFNIPDKSVLITFDDGFYSFKYLVKPLLEKYEFNAICFIIGKVTWQITPEYDATKYGTIALDEINNSGQYVTYGSHTFYLHEQTEDGKPLVKNKKYDELKDDTKQFNEKLFDAKFLAYPYYTYTSDFIKVLKEQGYKLAFAGEEEMATKNVDNYKVPRISGVKDMETFKKIFESNTYKNKYGNGILRKIILKIKRLM